MKKKVLYGFRYESLKEKICYMLSLSLIERYTQNLSFAELMNLSQGKRYEGDRKAFRTIQIIKEK